MRLRPSIGAVELPAVCELVEAAAEKIGVGDYSNGPNDFDVTAVSW